VGKLSVRSQFERVESYCVRQWWVYCCGVMNTDVIVLDRSALSLTFTRVDSGFIGATLHVVQGDIAFDVACDMYPMREEKWTTTLDNRFNRVGLFASSIEGVREALAQHGVDAPEWFDFVKTEAWTRVAPHADDMYRTTRKDRRWTDWSLLGTN
jgi:hypothetical protein